MKTKILADFQISISLPLKTSNELEFIIDGYKLCQASIVYGKNELLELLVLQ